MKINANSSRGPEKGVSRPRGQVTVELMLFLAFTVCGVFHAFNYIKDRQEDRISATEAREKANEVVLMAEAAERAGLDLVVEGDITQTVRRVSDGATARSGAFQGQYFGLHGLDQDAQDAVRKHLELRHGRLAMKPANPELVLTIAE